MLGAGRKARVGVQEQQNVTRASRAPAFICEARPRGACSVRSDSGMRAARAVAAAAVHHDHLVARGAQRLQALERRADDRQLR